MRLLIVDDHEVVRRGVRSLLLEQSEFEVCGEAVDGQDALEQAREVKPDLIVMDLSMPKLNGLEATRQVRSMLPDCEVLILSQHENPEMARQALKAGARGYVVKSSVSKDLIAALTKISRREYFFDPAILEQTSSAHIDTQEILQRSAAFEQALRQSEELYRSTFELAAVGVAHVSPEGKWLRVNKKLCDIVGYSEPELLNLSFHDITHSDDLAAEIAQWEKVRNGTLDTYSMEKRYVRKDGSYIWVNRTVSCVRDASDKLRHFISVVEDISARKSTEAALRESQERLQLAQQVANVGTFDSESRLRAAFSQSYSFLVLLQPDGTIIEANRAALNAAGGDASKVVGHKFWEPWWSPLPDEVAVLKGVISKVATGQTVRDECQFCLPDGTRRLGDRTLSPVLDDHGRVVMIVATGLDVTDGKQSETATGLLASIVASSDDAIVSKTLDGIITSWNQSAEKLFGYSAAEAVGQHITLIIPPDRHTEEADILSRLRRGERIEHFETVRQRKEGSLVEVSITISPVRDSEGRIIGASKVARDITAKRQSERALATGTQQQRALFHLADELQRASSMEEIYTAALNAILDALQCNRASILLSDDAEIMRFKSWRGLSNEYRAAVDRHSAWRPDEKNPQPVCIGDFSSADISESLKSTVKREGIAALAFIPLISSGRLIGKFMVYFNRPHRFGEHELDLSLTIARQLAFAIERTRNDEELQRSEERLRRLSESLDAEVARQTEQVRSLTHDLLRTQDEERRHIARELHDSAGQTLTVLGMNLAQLGQDVGRAAPEIGKKVEGAQGLGTTATPRNKDYIVLATSPLLD